MMYNNYATINDAETVLLNSGVDDFYKSNDKFLNVMYWFNLTPNVFLTVVEECGSIYVHQRDGERSKITQKNSLDYCYKIVEQIINDGSYRGDVTESDIEYCAETTHNVLLSFNAIYVVINSSNDYCDYYYSKLNSNIVAADINDDICAVAGHNDSEATNLAITIYKNFSDLRYFS